MLQKFTTQFHKLNTFKLFLETHQKIPMQAQLVSMDLLFIQKTIRKWNLTFNHIRIKNETKFHKQVSPRSTHVQMRYKVLLISTTQLTQFFFIVLIRSQKFLHQIFEHKFIHFSTRLFSSVLKIHQENRLNSYIRCVDFNMFIHIIKNFFAVVLFLITPKPDVELKKQRIFSWPFTIKIKEHKLAMKANKTIKLNVLDQLWLETMNFVQMKKAFVIVLKGDTYKTVFNVRPLNAISDVSNKCFSYLRVLVSVARKNGRSSTQHISLLPITKLFPFPKHKTWYVICR